MSVHSRPCLRALQHHVRSHRAGTAPSCAPRVPAPLQPRSSRGHATFDPSRAASKKGGISATPRQPPTEPSNDLTARLAQSLRSTAPSLTETYVAYGATELLVKECARVADYTIPASHKEIPATAKGEHLGVPAAANWWHGELGLEPTFNSWAQVGMLHLWLLTARLRALDGAGVAAQWQQHLTDHFFVAAETKMQTQHRLDSRMMRQRYLKELYLQWRGVTAAYDEGFVKGDAVLAAAVWRNVGQGRGDVDLKKLAMVVAYMRSGIKVLGEMGDEVVAAADVVFGDPSGEEDVVRRKARGISEPFADAKA